MLIQQHASLNPAQLNLIALHITDAFPTQILTITTHSYITLHIETGLSTASSRDIGCSSRTMPSKLNFIALYLPDVFLFFGILETSAHRYNYLHIETGCLIPWIRFTRPN